MNGVRMLWLDGLPLAPQHFQEADRLAAASIEARVGGLVRGVPWGLASLAIDRRALREGVVRIERLEAVMPDGTVVRVHEGSDVRIDDRPISGLGPDRAVVGVRLALPRARAGRTETVGGQARLRILARTASDLHTETPAEPVSLELGVPNVRLVFDHEPREELETLPLFQVRRDERGELVVADAVVGPLLRIGASEPLCARLSGLVERLGVRRAALLAARRERDGQTVEVDPADVTRFFLLTAIATHHPVLRHLLVRADARPEVLHDQLLALAGALGTLAVHADAELPDLDPLEPGAALVGLIERVERLLALTDRERARVIPLEPRADGLHFAPLDDESIRAERFVLSVRSTLAPHEVEATLASLAKVASYGEIASVLGAATGGAPLRVVHRPPPEVPVRAGETCFEVAPGDRHFRAALAERGVAVYLPTRPFDPAHTRLTLVAIARGERSTDRSFERALPA
jgi:type VI secretion system protein ImpJ